MRRGLLAAVLLVACHRDVATDDSAAAAASSTTSSVIDVEAGPSLYALSPRLVDQDGHAIALDVWRGHPVLVGMFYASCASACPLFVSTVRKLEDSLDAPTRSALRVLLVSFDPNDKPAVLSRLVAKHGIDTERWRLASGSEGDVRDLAAALGVKYRRLPDGNYNHSSPLILLGPDGTMQARVESIGDPEDGISDRLRALAR